MSFSRGRLSRFIVQFSCASLSRRGSPWQESRVASKPARPSADKARRGGISGIFARRATRSAGMHRPSNAVGPLPRAAGRARLTAACALLTLGSQALAQESDAGHLTLDRAVETALAANPHLAAVAAHAEALQAVPSQASTLPDPVLGLNAMNLPTDSFNLRQEPMTQIQLSFSQMIPYPGKRRLMADAAGYEAAAGLARAEDVRLELSGQVRAAWWRLFQHDRALEIVGQNARLMRDVIQIAQARYRVGDGLQQDVLLAQLELSRLLERELRLNGMRSRAEAALSALLGRTAGLSIALPPEPGNNLLPDIPADIELVAAAIASRPALAAERALMGAARARLGLAELNLRPNFTVGAGYGFRGGNDPFRGERPDFLSVMVGVTVPLYADSKQRKAIEQQNHEVSRREFAYDDAVRAIQAAIAGHRADYEAAREQVTLLETAIIPQAQQTAASMLAGYRVNEVDFLNVVNSQITLYNSRINYWEALGTAKAALAMLAASAGMEVLYE